ncbi:MAG: hypothetical protein OET90_10170 [Desulfuromonadales bacterium]|nr:hypothetical protein [Desulfuromonadales bacterium]
MADAIPRQQTPQGSSKTKDNIVQAIVPTDTLLTIKLMKNKTTIDNEKKLLTCSLEGAFDVDASIALAQRLRTQARELGCNILYDARKLQISDSIFPVYEFATRLSSIIDTLALRKIKVAFLHQDNDHDAQWKFYEDTAVNRMLLIKVFQKEQEAIAWLSN